ncbi:MAG: hypothetical protein A2283_17355 [Lentisphaerae bacterium RIFOXYA12_FULL_48_11]|nr:MAG: hypothetical protein A2283_17355 [Lentisphaerae bacterium RIFOXYA12_FULL_48_11]
MSRRSFMQGTAGAIAFVSAGCAKVNRNMPGPVVEKPSANGNLYSDLLKTWCDAMIGLQVLKPEDSAMHGLISCPGCAHTHGRCADSLYPLMYMARTTGDRKYLDAAVRVQAWSDNVTQQDGSWLNEVSGSKWKGITVFGTIALADALHYHGELLDSKVREKWTDRLSRAIKFIDGYMTMNTGNINYPVTSSLAFASTGRVLGSERYAQRAREFAHDSLKYFTKNHFLFGEGKPKDATTAKGARPVDLGYNVEESLPALAMYGLMTGDKEVLECVVNALKTHMEFLLPDGGWDNSWGSRNYKWTWWGSRTSDGCQPAYALLAKYDPSFREVAWRNLEQLAACTHDGLLYGGPHYRVHGEKPCVHHTFTHAKALATVLDHKGTIKPEQKMEIPRGRAYGLKSYPEIGAHLVAVGSWRATVTEYDWEYTVGGQASGGALSLLYHMDLGPVLSASMTEYRMVEEHNQQFHGNYPTMCLTPRIEYSTEGNVYTSLSDLKSRLSLEKAEKGLVVTAEGSLQTIKHDIPDDGDVRYRLVYKFTETSVKITAGVTEGNTAGLKLIVPVVSSRDEGVKMNGLQSVCIRKAAGLLIVRTDAVSGFEKFMEARVFNLVPGFECLPLVVVLPGMGKEVSMELSRS